MPPRTKKAATPQAPSTMKELKDTLWKAADKLRGSMDASQYKDVILGLVFLKYVSDSFDERREQIRTDLAAEGFVTNVPGKGSYVLPRNAELVRERVLREVTEHFTDAVAKARLVDLTPAELHTALDLVLTKEQS